MLVTIPAILGLVLLIVFLVVLYRPSMLYEVASICNRYLSHIAGFDRLGRVAPDTQRIGPMVFAEIGFLF